MPRANRYFLPGLVWHTHRCHRKDFLLKFSKDRSTWIHWLFESRKRYGMEILNYAVTSNHIHLLVYGNENKETIPRSLQLVAGRTAQAFNQRKNRKGAFWEDRYHATAMTATTILSDARTGRGQAWLIGVITDKANKNRQGSQVHPSIKYGF